MAATSGSFAIAFSRRRSAAGSVRVGRYQATTVMPLALARSSHTLRTSGSTMSPPVGLLNRLAWRYSTCTPSAAMASTAVGSRSTGLPGLAYEGAHSKTSTQVPRPRNAAVRSGGAARGGLVAGAVVAAGVAAGVAGGAVEVAGRSAASSAGGGPGGSVEVGARVATCRPSSAGDRSRASPTSEATSRTATSTARGTRMSLGRRRGPGMRPEAMGSGPPGPRRPP